ncbi:unnamed protein product [Camellia sinensis]
MEMNTTPDDVKFLDPRTFMDSDFFCWCSASDSGSDSDSDLDLNFELFAFNDSDFSDRVLRIEIIPDKPESDSTRNRKSSIEDIDKENDGFVEDEDVQNIDSFWNMDCSMVLGVKNVHISSPILAAKSPFFCKLFSNGMRESEQRHVTLRIHASEEAALMDLLNFMYSSTLSTTTPSALLDVLMAADKFEVISCMKYCSRLLQYLPMTLESAWLCLDLPSSVSMAEAVQPVTDAAKQFLATWPSS